MTNLDQNAVKREVVTSQSLIIAALLCNILMFMREEITYI